MSYSKHIFFCTNDHGDNKPCCARFNSQQMRKYAKDKLTELGQHGEGKIRVSSSGCLGKCAMGPVIVVYPEDIWYSWVDKKDIDEIIDCHLLNDKVVERLLLS